MDNNTNNEKQHSNQLYGVVAAEIRLQYGRLPRLRIEKATGV